MRKTKIVCTLGPATDQPGVLEELISSGMNVARMNFSHGNYEEHKGRMERVKEIRKKMGLPIALLLDTKGPEIRIKDFENGIKEESVEIKNIISQMVQVGLVLEAKLDEIHESAVTLKNESNSFLNQVLVIVAIVSVLIFFISSLLIANVYCFVFPLNV